MQSYEVLKNAVDKVGVKQVAAALNVSQSLVYKWCQRPRSTENDTASGTRNPLDRLRTLSECTGGDLSQWLCEQEGGFFVQNPKVDAEAVNEAFVANTQRIIQDFSDLLRVMSESIANENRIDKGEALQIREEWETLKRYTERFVRGCEQGLFDSM